MAECPMCGSHLDVIQYRWITNVLGLTKPYFQCPACKWKMTIAEVTRRGGLHGIKAGMASGMGRRNPLADPQPGRDQPNGNTVGRPSGHNQGRRRGNRGKGNRSRQRYRWKQRQRQSRFKRW